MLFALITVVSLTAGCTTYQDRAYYDQGAPGYPEGVESGRIDYTEPRYTAPQPAWPDTRWPGAPWPGIEVGTPSGGMRGELRL